jgi:hypothetical protein
MNQASVLEAGRKDTKGIELSPPAIRELARKRRPVAFVGVARARCANEVCIMRGSVERGSLMPMSVMDIESSLIGDSYSLLALLHGLEKS